MSLTAQTIRNILASIAVCLVVVASANEAASQVTVDSEKEPRGSVIRGVVTYADTGRPMRHTTVVIIGNDSGNFQTTGVSDERGHFALSHVPAGRYIVYVDAPGILRPGRVSRDTGSVTSQLRLNQTRDLFVEVVVNGTDSLDVKLQGVRGGVITGRVVTDDDEPVAGAEVKLLKRENGNLIPMGFTSRGDMDQQWKTDPSGVYRIAGLAAGDYIVRVSEPSISFDRMAHQEDAYSDGSLMVAYHPAASTIKEAQSVTVVEGAESTGIDVRMPDRTPRTISGTVRFGPDEEPAGYVGIRVERVDEAGFGSVLDTNTRTDRDGTWVLAGIPAGEYVIRFSGSARIGSPETGGHIYIAPKQVRVSVGNDDVVLNTKLVESAIITGTVKFDGPAPERLHELNPGVIRVGEGAESQWGYMRENGKFEVRELAAGKYRFEISGFRADQFYLKSITRKGVDLTQNPFKLEDGAKFSDVVITFGTDLASIEGQVSDLKPKTAPGERKIAPGDVVVVLAPADDATRRFSPGLLTVHPDAQGRFIFACGPGEYFIAVIPRSQREKITMPITEEYFQQDNQKFLRVKVRAGEKLKGLTASIGLN